MWIFKRIYRERRRALVGGTLIALAVSAALLPEIDGNPMRTLFNMIAAILTAIILMIPAILVATLLPAFRFGIEVITVFLLASVVLPPFGNVESFLSETFLGNAAVLAAAYAYFSAWLDGYLKGGPTRIVTRTTHRGLTPEAVFPFLMSEPSKPENWPAGTRDVTWLEEDRVLRNVHRWGPTSFVVEDQRVLHREPPRLLQLAWSGPYAEASDPLCHGVRTWELRPYKDGVEMIGTREPTHLPQRARLFAWIDDSFGRIDDDFLRDVARRVKASRVESG